jgi:predicted DNA binding CopG/RHH family protein
MTEDVKRDKMLTIPVSEAELNLTKQEADKLGMPVTAFIRLLIKNFSDGVTFEKKG